MKLFNLKKAKESYIIEKASELAIDYNFIKSFTLNLIEKYSGLLLNFIKKNDFIIHQKVKKAMKNKDESFMEIIDFIFSIPKLIRKNNKKFEIDYVFLNDNFQKFNNDKKRKKWKNNLEKTQKYFNFVTDFSNFKKDYNIRELYKYGNFILDYLTDFDLRQDIIKKLIKETYDNDIKVVQENIELDFIKQHNENTWLNQKQCL